MLRLPGCHKRAAVSGVFSVAAVVLALVAIVTAPARAQDAQGSSVDSALETMGVKTDPGSMPDFVRASRPKQEPDFMSVGTQHPTRPIKVKTPAELEAAKASLDAARVHHDKISGRKQPDANAKRQPKPVETKASQPVARQN